jgi:pimeloyl-ACP methyl ester carboxylesterase
MPDPIEPFLLSVSQRELDGLRQRLADTRWPERETVDDLGQGAPLERVRALCDYWGERYDWRRCEAMLNGFGQYRTALDGFGIHFLHVRSPEPDALPMIMTHGWPGSVIEFHKVIGPLVDPVAYGGQAGDAFHLVLPSLPGYAFSEKPTAPGWGFERIARAWAALMDRLGYDRYVAQGGDFGADVVARLGTMRPSGLLAVHLNTLFFDPEREASGDPTPDEQRAAEKARYFEEEEYGYYKEQGTRPQTIGYGLADSPAGQAAWIYEKLQAWTDNPGRVEEILSLDEILDNIMLYWLPNAGASSARLYWENFDDTALPIDLPVGVSQFPADINYAPRSWAERYYHNIIHWRELDRGGHFAAFEQPDLFAREVRDCFRGIR